MTISPTKEASTGKLILPSAWNYGLLIDTQNIMRGLKVTENPVGKYPFADKGDMIWSADSGRYIAWTGDAPVLINCKGNKDPGMDHQE